MKHEKYAFFCKKIFAFLDFQALESLLKKSIFYDSFEIWCTLGMLILIKWLEIDLGGGIKSPACPYVGYTNEETVNINFWIGR